MPQPVQGTPRIGIVSLTHFHGFSYAAGLKSIEDAEFTAIWDENAERGQKAAEKYGVPFVKNLDDIWDKVDAVSICAANADHKDLTLAAAAHKKHVLCEKPIATKVEDAVAMIRACREADVWLAMAFVCRYSPASNRIKSAIERGTVGSVLAARTTNRGQNPGDWFTQLDKSGGGAVIDHTVHVVDLLRWYMSAEVVSVSAEIGNLMAHGDYDDTGMLTLEFDNDCFATLDTSWSRPKSNPTWGDVTMELIGTGANVALDMFAQNIVALTDSDMRIHYLSWGSDLDAALMRDFVRALRTGTPPLTSGVDGLRALEVALAAYESGRTHRTVQVQHAQP